MGFKYSAFHENTPEAREWLGSIGYEPCPCVGDDPQDLIFTDHERGKFHGYDKETYGGILAEREDIGGDEVNCRGNFELFRAVTAMRDDSNHLQWFTDGKDWCVYEESVTPFWGKVGGYNFNYMPENQDMDKFHKANLEELINHFKSKSNGIRSRIIRRLQKDSR